MGRRIGATAMAALLAAALVVVGGGAAPTGDALGAATGPFTCFRREQSFEVTAARAFRTLGTVGTDGNGNTYVTWRDQTFQNMSKYDADGDEVWERRPATYGTVPGRVRVAPDGTSLVVSTGGTNPNLVGYNTVHLVTTNNVGSQSWTLDELPNMWRPKAAALRPGGGVAVLSEMIGGGPQDPVGDPRVDVWDDEPLFDIVTADTSPSWDPTAIPEVTEDIDVGSDGRIWVSSGFAAPEGRLWVFSPTGTQVRHIDPNLPTSSFFPDEIDVVGADVWVLTSGNPGWLHRIGPSSSTPTEALPWTPYGGSRWLVSFDLTEDGTELVTIDVDVTSPPAAGLWRVRRWDVTTCRFVDAPPDHPFFDEVEWMAEQEISTGYDDGTYRPSATVTRQAMSAFMYRLAGSPAFSDPVTPTFGDVGTSNPFFTEIEWMASTGITTGTPASPKPLYKPNAAVSRGAMSAFLYRLAGAPPFDPPTSTTFGDVTPSHPFFAEIEWMADESISTGTAASPKPLYKPADAVSRGAMSAFMFRLAEGPGVGV